MTTHILKCWPNYYDAIERGDKTFDVRRDDRGFQRGDIVVLQRTMPNSLHNVEFGFGLNVKHELSRTITWILTGGQFGIEPGYVVLALKPPHRTHPDHGT